MDTKSTSDKCHLSPTGKHVRSSPISVCEWCAETESQPSASQEPAQDDGKGGEK